MKRPEDLKGAHMNYTDDLSTISEHRNSYSITEKQDRYTRGSGDDLIDDWARTRTHDEFRTIMFAQVEKYARRLGEKDAVVNEVGKMLDYMNRWHQQELKWVEQNARGKDE